MLYLRQQLRASAADASSHSHRALPDCTANSDDQAASSAQLLSQRLSRDKAPERVTVQETSGYTRSGHGRPSRAAAQSPEEFRNIFQHLSASLASDTGPSFRPAHCHGPTLSVRVQQLLRFPKIVQESQALHFSVPPAPFSQPAQGHCAVIFRSIYVLRSCTPSTLSAAKIRLIWLKQQSR